MRLFMRNMGGVSGIGSNAFLDARHLRWLDLSNNRINELSLSVFDGAENLRFLDR